MTATMADAAELLGDPVAVFGKLVREVEAGTVLVSLAMTGDETRRAALDALQLARDVLDDAGRQLLDAAAATTAGAQLQQLDPELTTDAAPTTLLPTVDQTRPARPGGFTTTRTSCACGAVELDDDEPGDWPVEFYYNLQLDEAESEAGA